jgi:hypothetical protein
MKSRIPDMVRADDAAVVPTVAGKKRARSEGRKVMQRLKIAKGWVVAVVLALAGCTVTATPMVRRQAAIHGEPYVFYEASAPYVYVDGAVWSYDAYYVQYYGPTYAVPAPPPRAGRISPPPPTVVGGDPGRAPPPGHGGDGNRGRGHGHR